MRLLSKKGLILTAAMLAFAGTALGAPPTAFGTLTCMTTPDATGTANSLTTQVSWYSVGLQNTVSIGSQSGGAGAGKVTFSPADLHISLSKFTEFLPIAQTGRALQQCTLVSTAGNGVTATYTFQLVAVASVTAVAGAGNGPNSVAYTDLQLEYGALTVMMTNAVDDGGTNPDNK